MVCSRASFCSRSSAIIFVRFMC